MGPEKAPQSLGDEEGDQPRDFRSGMLLGALTERLRPGRNRDGLNTVGLIVAPEDVRFPMLAAEATQSVGFKFL